MTRECCGLRALLSASLRPSCVPAAPSTLPEQDGAHVRRSQVQAGFCPLQPEESWPTVPTFKHSMNTNVAKAFRVLFILVMFLPHQHLKSIFVFKFSIEQASELQKVLCVKRKVSRKRKNISLRLKKYCYHHEI